MRELEEQGEEKVGRRLRRENKGVRVWEALDRLSASKKPKSDPVLEHNQQQARPGNRSFPAWSVWFGVFAGLGLGGQMEAWS
jgi:hypothetical protein